MMRVLGIDPGLLVTGYAVLDSQDGEISVVEAGVVRTPSEDSLERRLMNLGSDLAEIIKQFAPAAMAVEELYSHYNHPRTAIVMGHARGVIFLKAAEMQIPVFPYPSTRIKNSLTGNGRATKRQVQQMLCSSLRLTTMPEPPDAADAMAVAMCHIHVLSHQAEVTV